MYSSHVLTLILFQATAIAAAALLSPIRLTPADLGLEKRDVTVTYCNSYDGDAHVCGGVCATTTVDGAKCLDVPGTACLKADANVIFCNDTSCGVDDATGACNNFNQCGVIVEHGYCYTPGTNSIQT